MSELVWGPIMAGYLFFGGLAGGAYVVSALADLFKGEDYEALSKSGTYVSFFSILIGLVLLVLDLKRFQVAPLGILNAYRRFPDSILTVGTWTITGFIAISLVTSILWLFKGNALARKIVEIVGIVLGLTTTAYTGLLLAFARGATFWSSPLLPWTFVVSGTLTGLSITLFMIPIFAVFMPRLKPFWELYNEKSKFAEMVGRSQKYVAVLIVIELVLVIIELATGHGHVEILLTGSILSLIFYTYLMIGLVAPLGISYYTTMMKSKTKDEYLILFSMGQYALILMGGLLLRYVILTAGQIFH
jgi:formate-dependent nitrite reductase membrane component NrfD